MTHFLSSFSFSNNQEWRTFHHRWHSNDGREIIECNTCCSTCNSSDGYSQHWATASGSKLQISTKQLEQLAVIDKLGIQKFMLCQSKAAKGDANGALPTIEQSKHHFVLEAGMKAIPQFLRFLFHDADELTLQMGLHVSVRELLQKRDAKAKEFLYQSSLLAVRTHYDIKESIDTMLTMLLERVECQLHVTSKGCLLESFEVKRIELQVQRFKWLPQRKPPVLPLQYSVKHACYEQKDAAGSVECRRLLSLSMRANYYGFYTCDNSNEIFVVPLKLQPAAPMPVINTPNVIVLDDVHGNPQDFLIIRNLAKFLCHQVDDCVLSCRRCAAKFMQQAHLVLHKRLKCGSNFRIVEMSADRVEIYEHCLALQCEELNWPIFGIVY